MDADLDEKRDATAAGGLFLFGADLTPTVAAAAWATGESDDAVAAVEDLATATADDAEVGGSVELVLGGGLFLFSV